MATVVPISSCLVVGAGISGLLAAHELREAGVEVTVLDKGRGVGGRMATRRFGESGGAVFDHGAQFFTVRGERFGSLVEGWLAEGAVAEWSRGFPTPQQTPEDGHPRYRGSEGMTSIPKHLARTLDVRSGEMVAGVDLRDSGWRVTAESGTGYEADALLITVPAPQALSLAESGGFRLASEDREALAAITYDPCVALMARLDEGESPVPEPGGLQIKSEPLDWISDNHTKGISPEPGLTIHAGPGWSSRHYEDPDEEVTGSLLELAGETLGADLGPRVRETSVARWRYSWVTEPHPEPCLTASSQFPMIFAGDGFGQPKVEGAALSGLAAADRLLGRG
ncbi:NAD(P)/FAD-dependent oxidoreductase [Rubrobacter aplysinae]|uniref:NAD(P)/FAD-dependent oxidoreductase n=1 Tax=Rubrobacter aplysinae TaxID=909625 RepID=UPI00064BD73F|nr:FAD-dependent oxidoreductase [Rubrobacter aplysinae]